MSDATNDKDMLNRIRRLMMERDLLLGAIAPADYEKIRERMIAISDSPDE